MGGGGGNNGEIFNREKKKVETLKADTEKRVWDSTSIEKIDIKSKAVRKKYTGRFF